MTQLAFIFPGQGSQRVGMGAELARAYPIANTTFQEADAALGRALSQLCFEGPEETLKQTENTQLAILTCSVDDVTRSKGIRYCTKRGRWAQSGRVFRTRGSRRSRIR